jgi:hypothetical protein
MGYGYYPFKKDKRLVKYINQLGYFYKDIAWNTYKPYGNILFWSGVTYSIYYAGAQEHARKVPAYFLIADKNRASPQ